MTSKNQHATHILDHILNVNVLMFAFLAIMFFNLGRSYAQIKMKMEERKTKRSGFGANSMYKKNDDMDEERQQMNDENEYLRTVRAELEESRQEVRQLSEELRRLRQKESSLDAENQILKSKLLQAESLGGKKDTSASGDHGAPSFIPKLQAPSTGSPKQESFPYHQENNFYSGSAFDSNTANQHDYSNSYNNYNYNDYSGQGSGYYGGHHNNDNADEQAINDIDDFLKEDGF